MRFTPELITHLEPDEIFVFGSNVRGVHGAGAALIAHKKFGARWGLGIGLSGQTYAIPTKYTPHGAKVSGTYLRKRIDNFRLVAQGYREKTFLVTKIGCGLAGFSTEFIGRMFGGMPSNVILPIEFHEALFGVKVPRVE